MPVFAKAKTNNSARRRANAPYKYCTVPAEDFGNARKAVGGKGAAYINAAVENTRNKTELLCIAYAARQHTGLQNVYSVH